MSIQGLAAFLSWNWTFWSALLLYSVACIGTGLIAIRLSAGARGAETLGSPVAVVGVGAALGLGLLGQFWTLLALVGQFRLAIILITLGLMAIAVLIHGPALRRNLVKQLKDARTALQLEGFGLRLVVLAIMVSIGLSFAALGRPFSGDGLALHLMIPKVAAASGMLERHWFQPGNEYFGVLGEMTFAALMRIGKADAAQMSTWAVLLVFIALLVGICERVGLGLRGKIIAIAAFASTTAVLIWIGEGKIDLIASALGLASLYLLVPRADLAPLPRHNLILAGLLAGFAVTAKLMLGFCLVVASAVLLLWTYAPPDFRTRTPWREWLVRWLVPLLSAGLLFGVFMLIGLAPQFIKNAVLLNAPLAPIGTAGTNWLVRELWYDAGTVRHIRLLYPFVLTFGEYFAQYGQLSVLVLAFLPLALFMPRPASFWHSPLTAITVAAAVAIVVWATFQGDKVVMRYILPVLLLFIPLAAAAAEHVTDPAFRPRLVRTTVIGACLATLTVTASSSLGLYYFPAQATRTVFKLAGPCERGLQWCGPMHMINRLAPDGARVFSVSSFKYDLRPDLIQCSYGHRMVAFPGDDAEQRWRWFYDQGYRFVLPDPSGNPAHLLADLDKPPAWVKVTRYEPDNPLGAIQISYDLTKGGPTAPPKTTCRQARRNAWKIEQTGS
jgi:hypothetical protein